VQGSRDPDLFRIVDRLDTRGKAYYWIGVERRRAKPPKGTDLWAVRCNLLSVTPLCLDATDEEARQKFSEVLSESVPRPAKAPPPEKARAAEKVHSS
jgi:5'-nucleotidase